MYLFFMTKLQFRTYLFFFTTIGYFVTFIYFKIYLSCKNVFFNSFLDNKCAAINIPIPYSKY